jgi:hypothetical protein
MYRCISGQFWLYFITLLDAQLILHKLYLVIFLCIDNSLLLTTGLKIMLKKNFLSESLAAALFFNYR